MWLSVVAARISVSVPCGATPLDRVHRCGNPTGVAEQAAQGMPLLVGLDSNGAPLTVTGAGTSIIRKCI
jgi:hypothetical protein